MDGKAKSLTARAPDDDALRVRPCRRVNQHTWTGGWGTVTYWNAYVANTQMCGKGTVY